MNEGIDQVMPMVYHQKVRDKQDKPIHMQWRTKAKEGLLITKEKLKYNSAI